MENLEDNDVVDYRLSHLFELTDDPDFCDTDLFLYNEIISINDRYCDFNEIGVGGMKRVFRAYDKKNRRVVAYATLRYPENKELYDNFIREAHLSSSLMHPNIIPIYDVGVDMDGFPYFTMELKTGKLLTDIVADFHSKNENSVSLDQLLTIFLKICDAVAYSHSQNVLHLDLKPDNVQVGHFGEVLLCDWGLAKIISSDDSQFDTSDLVNPDLLNNLSINGELKGTPGFMAPEQAKVGGTKGFQTDVYGLGSVLFFLLTGRAPVIGDLEHVINNTISGNISSTLEINNNIPQALDSIAMKALSVDPTNRYQSVAEFQQDIVKYTNGYATIAENAGFVTLLKLLYKRNRTISMIVTFFMVILTFGSVYFINNLNVSRREALRDRDRANKALADYKYEVMRNVELSGKISDSYMERGRVPFVNITLDGVAIRKHYLKTLEAQDKSLALNPNNQEVLLEKGYTLLVMQRFAEAASFFSQVDSDKAKRLSRICKSYGLPLKKKKIHSADTISDMVTELILNFGQKIHPVITKIMIYDFAIRHSYVFHSKVVLSVIKALNPSWHDIVYEFNYDMRSLVIGGNGLSHLKIKNPNGLPVSVLFTLRLSSLTFSKTDFSNMQQIVNLPLPSLDISQTEIKDYSLVPRIRSLVELTIKESDYTEENKKFFPKRIVVHTRK